MPLAFANYETWSSREKFKSSRHDADNYPSLLFTTPCLLEKRLQLTPLRLLPFGKGQMLWIIVDLCGFSVGDQLERELRWTGRRGACHVRWGRQQATTHDNYRLILITLHGPSYSNSATLTTTVSRTECPKERGAKDPLGSHGHSEIAFRELGS